MSDEADYQLQVIYLWVRNSHSERSTLLDGLRDRHPRNPLFLQLIAEVQDSYLHDLTAQPSIVAGAPRRREGSAGSPAPSWPRRGRGSGAALELDRLFEADAAIEHLRVAIAAKPSAPLSVPWRRHSGSCEQALDRMSDPPTGFRSKAGGPCSKGRASQPRPGALAQSLALRPDDPSRAIATRSFSSLRRMTQRHWPTLIGC